MSEKKIYFIFKIFILIYKSNPSPFYNKCTRVHTHTTSQSLAKMELQQAQQEKAVITTNFRIHVDHR